MYRLIFITILFFSTVNASLYCPCSDPNNCSKECEDIDNTSLFQINCPKHYGLVCKCDNIKTLGWRIVEDKQCEGPCGCFLREEQKGVYNIINNLIFMICTTFLLIISVILNLFLSCKLCKSTFCNRKNYTELEGDINI